MGLLTGKVALITGGSRGIGAAIVRRFVDEGARVAFTYLSSPEKAELLVSELQADGTTVRAYRSDAARYDEAEALVQTVITDFGQIDILINNAGITRDNLMLRM